MALQGDESSSSDVIVLDHVAKRFADFVAVHEANFSIGRASSSRCSAHRAAERPPPCG